MSKDRDHQIRSKAYELWEKAGRPHGQAESHWFEAEGHVHGAGAAESPAPAGAAKSVSTKTDVKPKVPRTTKPSATPKEPSVSAARTSKSKPAK